MKFCATILRMEKDRGKKDLKYKSGPNQTRDLLLVSEPIKNWPVSERPRERIMSLGGGALNLAEILAIFFRTGYKDKSAVELGFDLLVKYGGLHGLHCAAADGRLATAKGMGPSKIAPLLAAFEFNNRYNIETVKNGIPLQSPEIIYQLLLQDLHTKLQEEFCVILLDSQNRFLTQLTLSRGMEKLTDINPRLVIEKALENRAAAIIVAHNHPGQNPAPSTSDLVFTDRMSDACDLMNVGLQDHIIVGESEYFSFQKEDMLKTCKSV